MFLHVAVGVWVNCTWRYKGEYRSVPFIICPYLFLFYHHDFLLKCHDICCCFSCFYKIYQLCLELLFAVLHWKTGEKLSQNLSQVSNDRVVYIFFHIFTLLEKNECQICFSCKELFVFGKVIVFSRYTEKKNQIVQKFIYFSNLAENVKLIYAIDSLHAEQYIECL